MSMYKFVIKLANFKIKIDKFIIGNCYPYIWGCIVLNMIQQILEVDELISYEIEKIKKELGDWFIDEYPIYQAS